MKTYSVVLFALTFALMLTGCQGSNSDAPSPAIKNFTYYLSEEGDGVHETLRQNTLTVGNHSFVPLDEEGRPDQSPRQILALLKLFEDQHPELRVTRWVIQRDQKAYITSPYIYGLWIDHEPKRMPPDPNW